MHSPSSASQLLGGMGTPKRARSRLRTVHGDWTCVATLQTACIYFWAEYRRTSDKGSAWAARDLSNSSPPLVAPRKLRLLDDARYANLRIKKWSFFRHSLILDRDCSALDHTARRSKPLRPSARPWTPPAYHLVPHSATPLGAIRLHTIIISACYGVQYPPERCDCSTRASPGEIRWHWSTRDNTTVS